jgi:hypothetical protein
MIHPIAPPPFEDLAKANWWVDMLQHALGYWLVILGLLVCVGYIAWMAYSAWRAHREEPSASFVSLACARRMATASADGTRHFLVHTEGGFPDVQQFEHVLPAYDTVLRLSYRNEWHAYSFRIVKRQEGEYDAFVLKLPRYEGRPNDAAATFRADVGTGAERLAFRPGVEPVSLPDAVRKAIFWAEANSRYILHGFHWSAAEGPVERREGTSHQPHRGPQLVWES